MPLLSQEDLQTKEQRSPKKKKKVSCAFYVLCSSLSLSGKCHIVVELILFKLNLHIILLSKRDDEEENEKHKYDIFSLNQIY